MTPHSTRSRLLTLLQHHLNQHPDRPISFVALASELGISRQYARVLYHQLKTTYPVPPVGRTGFGANDPDTRRLIARKGGTQAHALGKAHTFSHDEAVRARRAGLKALKESRHR